ncbi:MAG: hotdog domain-containing protein [Acidimicrobiia bacterium]
MTDRAGPVAERRDDGRAFSYWLGLELDEIVQDEGAPPEALGRVDPGPHLRHADGRLRAGALLGMLDAVGGLNGGLAALPGWVVSTNITQRVGTLDVTGPVSLASRVLRTGRNAVVTTVEVHDGARRHVATGVLTSSILTFEGSAPVGARPFRLRLAGAAPPALPPVLPPLLGVEPVAPDRVRLAIEPELRNPWGILHGGAICLLVDVAVEHVAERVAGGPVAMTDAAVHFLAPGRVGPVEASGAIVGSRPDGHVTRVEVRDRGAGDRLLTVAVATVGRGG